jgi:hypothetical protein
MTFDEAEALLKTPQEVCVRAQITGRREVAFRDEPLGKRRRMMIAASTSISLLAAACQTSGNFPPKGIIAGKVEIVSVHSVSATAENGRVYRAKVQRDGSYSFNPLPFGSYALKFYGDCERWDGGTVEVRSKLASAAGPIEDPQDCIIIGQIMLDDFSSQAG